jgi:glycosyltransferase involved in cell wall biosynthesis
MMLANPRSLRPMRLAFLHGSNDLYGASRVLARDVELLRAQGHEVAVALPQDGPLTETLRALGADVSVESLRVLRKVDGAAGMRLPITLPTVCKNADVVVLWTLALAAYLPLLRLRRRRVLCSVHEILPGPAGRLLAATACALSHALMVNSRATAQWLTHDLRRQRPQLAYPIAPPYSPLARVAGGAGVLRLLVMGRVNGHKGHLEAVRAAQLARDTGEEIELTLLGGAFSGQEPHLVDLLAAVDGLPWVHYGGEVSEPRELFAGCDVVLIPSTTPESFGLVAIEAWAAGRRVIASDQGGLVEATAMVGGLVIAAGDVAALCQAIIHAARDPAARSAPAANAPVGELCTLAARESAWRSSLRQAASR